MLLQRERLLLRPWEERDRESLFALAKDPELGPACGWKPHQTPEESQAVLTKQLMNSYTWAIVRKEKEEEGPIGSLALMPFRTSAFAADEQERELSFWLGRAHWGQGYMTEACLTLLNWAFRQREIERICCVHAEDNLQSARVQEKCGFRFHHKCERVYVYRLDCYRNVVVNCMTKEEWQKRQEVFL